MRNARSKPSVDDALEQTDDPTVTSGLVRTYDPEKTVGYDAEKTVHARADYDPEKTVGYDAERTLARLSDPDDLPYSETELMESAPIEKTKRMERPSAPMIATFPVRGEAVAPASQPNIFIAREVELSKTQRVKRAPPAKNTSAPWPLWVHIVLASAFVACSVLFALLVFVAYR
jgi:hypothetical protein